MSQASTRIPGNKVWAIPIIRLALTQAGRRLFGGPDARARQHGWEVTVTHGGLGRRYRDPRFAALNSGRNIPAADRGVPAGGGGRRA